MATLSSLVFVVTTLIAVGLVGRIAILAIEMMLNPEEHTSYKIKIRNTIIAFTISLVISSIQWIIRRYI